MVIFDKIYVISLLKKRPEKIDKFCERFPEDLGNVQLFEAIDGNDVAIPDWWNPNLKGSYGCYSSHVAILHNMLDYNLNNVIVFEDDAIFCKDFVEKLNTCVNLLPDDWDQFYIGGQHLKSPTKINEYISKASNINRTHGYIIKNSESAKILLSYLEDKEFWINNFTKNKYHIDYGYGFMHNGIINAYCSNKFLIGQAANQYSDTGSQIIDKDRWWGGDN